MRRFKVKLGPVHEQSGVTMYRVAKETGLSQATVARYVNAGVIVVDLLAPAVLDMCDYYGVDWRDPAIIEVIEDEDEEASLPIPA